MANVNTTTPRMTSYDHGHQDKIMLAVMDTFDCASWVSVDCERSIANMKQSMFAICQDIPYTDRNGQSVNCDIYVLKTWNSGQTNFGLAVITANGDLAFKPQMSNSLVMSLVGVYMDYIEMDYMRPVEERRMRIAHATNFLANCKSWNPYSKTIV